MTRDSIVEKMAANAFASERFPWERMHPADKEDAIEAANDCLTALEQSIPGLSGVIEGTHAIIKLPEGFNEETNKMLVDALSTGFGAVEIKCVDPDAMIAAGETGE